MAKTSEHPLIAGGPTVGLMSPEAPRYDVLAPGGTENGGHAALQRELKDSGLRYEQTHGHYDGPENSYVIYGPSRQQMLDLGKKFGQEAVVFSPGDGQHELIYTNGPQAGKYHPYAGSYDSWDQEPPESYWTKLPGHGYVRLGFDFDKLNDVPQGTPYRKYEINRR